MQALVRFFWEMFLLRRRPQDLPASTPLTVLLLLVNLVVGTVGSGQMFESAATALSANVLDAALLAVLLGIALQLRGHLERWQQTYACFLGIGALVGLAMLLYRLPLNLLALDELVDTLNLILVIWAHVVLGHVLRHAIQVPLGLGVVVAFVYTLFSLRIVSYYFPIVTL